MKAKLDREMDDYFQAKTATVTEVATTTLPVPTTTA